MLSAFDLNQRLPKSPRVSLPRDSMPSSALHCYLSIVQRRWTPLESRWLHCAHHISVHKSNKHTYIPKSSLLGLVPRTNFRPLLTSSTLASACYKFMAINYRYHSNFHKSAAERVLLHFLESWTLRRLLLTVMLWACLIASTADWFELNSTKPAHFERPSSFVKSFAFMALQEESLKISIIDCSV